jgi:hypothetical protein
MLWRQFKNSQHAMNPKESKPPKPNDNVTSTLPVLDSLTESKLRYTYRRFEQYDFDGDQEFQKQLPVLLNLQSKKDASDDKTAMEEKILKAKILYFNR